MELHEALQLTTLKAMEGSKPTEPFVGKITSVSPLYVKVNNKITVGRKSLIMAKGLDLEVGDKVLCIRAPGGQKFYVICEVERNDTT